MKDSDNFLLDNQVFTLQQFHFHTPGENHTQGKFFPLEAHFVHVNQQGELTVVAVMYREGAANKQLEAMLQNIPDEADKVEPFKTPVDTEKLFPKDKYFYRFSSSLTTPLCIRWLVIKQAKTLSARQIEAFQRIFKACQ